MAVIISLQKNITPSGARFAYFFILACVVCDDPAYSGKITHCLDVQMNLQVLLMEATLSELLSIAFKNSLFYLNVSPSATVQ